MGLENEERQELPRRRRRSRRRRRRRRRRRTRRRRRRRPVSRATRKAAAYALPTLPKARPAPSMNARSLLPLVRALPEATLTEQRPNTCRPGTAPPHPGPPGPARGRPRGERRSSRTGSVVRSLGRPHRLPGGPAPRGHTTRSPGAASASQDGDRRGRYRASSAAAAKPRSLGPGRAGPRLCPCCPEGWRGRREEGRGARRWAR